MLLLIGAAVFGVAVFVSTRLARRGRPDDLGSMSSQWLADLRASHPS
jgi:hypothetical protein